MLSLANAFTEEDLINFEKKILNYLHQSNVNIFSIQQNQKLTVFQLH